MSVGQSDGEDDLKRRQLMELAIINGTYRDTATAGASVLNTALGPASVLAALSVPISRKSDYLTHCSNRDAAGDGRLRPWWRHLPNSAKQRCLTSDWCCHLVNLTKRMCRL